MKKQMPFKLVDPAQDTWCQNHKEETFSFDEYLQLCRSFHGHDAPGLVMGGKMVDVALKNIHPGTIFDAVSETTKCLPDAIQLLTPCTIGNGWLKITPLDKFALTLYDKHTGHGIRVSVDSVQLGNWSEIKNWMFGLTPKKDQDSVLLLKQIREAEGTIFKVETVHVNISLFKKQHLGQKAVCKQCGEPYPIAHGAVCRGCQGNTSYYEYQQ